MDISQKTDLCFARISGITCHETSSAELQVIELGRLRLWKKDFSTVASDTDRQLGSFLHGSSHLADALHAHLDLILRFLDTLENNEHVHVDGLHRPIQDDSDIPDASGPGYSVEQRTLMAVATVIDSLNRLLPTLYSPAPHDMLLDPRYASLRIDVRRDVDRVKTEFPKAATFLTARLGTLNSVRRAALEYGQTCFESTLAGIEEFTRTPIQRSESEVNEPDLSTFQQPERHAFSVFSGEVSRAGPQTLGSTDPSTLQSSTFDAAAQEPLAENDSASSAGSLTSYAATVNPRGDRTVRLPVPPLGALSGQPFTCTVCYRAIEGIRGSRRWKRHIFTDLRPYVCTFADCKSQMATFTRRRDWFEHEMDFHRSRYACPSPCDRIFRSAYDLQQHLVAIHATEITTEKAGRLSEMMKFTVTPASAPCPFCASVCNSMREYQRHVGGELERTALFIMPSGAVNMEADDSSSDGDDDDAQDSDDAQPSSAPSALSLKGKEKEMDVMEKLALSQTVEADEDGRKRIQPTVMESREPPKGWRPGERYCLLHGKSEVLWTLAQLNAAKPFSCTSLCGATFETKTQWKEHEEWNFPKALWICSWCADVFPRRSLLVQHQKIIHGRQRIDILTDCQDLGAFQRDCFFECGFSSHNFQNWVDHVASDVKEILSHVDQIWERATPADARVLGPKAALQFIRSNPKRGGEIRREEKERSARVAVADKTTEDNRDKLGKGMAEKTEEEKEKPDDVESKVLRQFRHFAEVERQRVIERRKAQSNQDRASKLNELLRFAKTYKLHTPIPTDLLDILAKGPVKEHAILEKAKTDESSSHEISPRTPVPGRF